MSWHPSIHSQSPVKWLLVYDELCPTRLWLLVIVIKNLHHCIQDKPTSTQLLQHMLKGENADHFELHTDWPHVRSIPICVLYDPFHTQSLIPTVTIEPPPLWLLGKSQTLAIWWVGAMQKDTLCGIACLAVATLDEWFLSTSFQIQAWTHISKQIHNMKELLRKTDRLFLGASCMVRLVLVHQLFVIQNTRD